MQESLGPVNVLLHLDPWIDNPIDHRVILEKLSGDCIGPIRMREFGVLPTKERQTNIPWDAWVDVIEAMLRHADEALPPFDGRDVDYYISGRAPLPLFAYLGVRLSKWANRVTVVNRRRSTLDWAILEPNNEGACSSFFAPAKRLSLGETGRVAVFISTDYKMNEDVVLEYMRERDEPLYGVVELSTPTQTWITPENIGAVIAEVDEELRGLHQHFPRYDGVVALVAGPIQLAMIVGQAINPRVHGSVEFPYWVRPEYSPATCYPRPPAKTLPKILVLTANPNDQPNIHDHKEIEQIKLILRKSLVGRRIEILFKTGVTPEDLLRALNRYEPYILQISAHGSRAGDIGLMNNEGTLRTASRDAVIEALLTAGKSVRVVLLNACYSAVLARRLLDHVEHLDYVIGVEEPLYSDTAIEFAKGFYLALAEGKDLDAAVGHSRTLAMLYARKRPDKIAGIPRGGFDPTSYIPFPKKSDPE